MAAIIEPRRLPPVTHERPALRLVAANGGRGATLPIDLGIRTAHLAIVAVALAVVVLAALAIGSGALASLAPEAPSGASASVGADALPAGASVVTVAPGDTLWTIARSLQPTGDVRPLVDQLVEANGSGPLQVGQEIVVPG